MRPVSDFAQPEACTQEFLRIHGFAEMRYHYVPLPGGSEQYVPVTVGLLF